MIWLTCQRAWHVLLASGLHRYLPGWKTTPRRISFWISSTCLLLALQPTLGKSGRLSASERAVDFAREVLPILSENCFHCHGPDPKTRQGDLRLDDEAAAKLVRDGRAGIVPQKPNESTVVARIRSNDPDERMPPPDSKRTLSPAQIETITRWIDQGARWSKHWAFELPQRAPLPDVSNPAWCQNPIDRFILKRLDDEQLHPSGPASRERLLRRLHLDLVGLPPNLEAIDACLVNNEPDAFDRNLDQLLASPKYGERMVWEWLEAARYADTNGYQGDPTRAMWYWRDWAIQAFNSGMPYDQFTIEQIAGDLLPSPTREQLIATGFHRNHMINGEGGRIAEESRAEYVQDRVETTGTVWLGLTLVCSRCHDHKYDPVSQREYYQLSAYFNSIEESGANDAGGLANPVISLISPEEQRQLDALKKTERDAQSQRDAAEGKVRGEQAAWEKTLVGEEGKLRTPEWTAMEPITLESARGSTLKKLDDGSILATGENPNQDDFVITAQLPRAGVTAFRLETLPDESLKNKGPGRASENGNYVLTEFKIKSGDTTLEIASATADFEQGSLTIKNTFDGNDATGWAILPEFGKTHVATFLLKRPIEKSDSPITVRLEHRSVHLQHVIGRFRVSVTSDSLEKWNAVPDAVRQALATEADKRTDAQKKAVTEHFLNTHPQVTEARLRFDEAKKRREQQERSFPRTMVMKERPQPRETFVLVKGAYNRPADKVEHGTLSCIPITGEAMSQGKNDRLALARWLIAPSNPLSPRVTVNRFWQQVFGIGLVKTTEDFGLQGDRPSHPELFDWLAVHFASAASANGGDEGGLGWDTKRLMRLMLSSSAYQQDSRVPAGLSERDPENRLLARGPRFRLPSWALRDQALAAAGILSERIGGPPVKTYQPDGIWEEATFGKIQYSQDKGESLYRRSLYIFWRRIVGPTLFFDVSTRQTCQVKVSRTNTPLHALVTLNDVTYVEAARLFAERILRSNSANDDERLEFGFRLVTSRHPTDSERQVLRTSLDRLRRQYTDDKEGAKKLITVGESSPDPQRDVVELAAFTGLATLLLNLDETLTKE